MSTELADAPELTAEVRAYPEDGVLTFRLAPDLEGFFVKDLPDGRRTAACRIGELPGRKSGAPGGSGG